MFNPYSYEFKTKEPLQIDIEMATKAFLASGGSIQVIATGVTALQLAPTHTEKKAAHKKTVVNYNPASLARAEKTMKIVKQGVLDGLTNQQIADLAEVTKNYVSALVCRHKLRAKPELV